VLVDMLGPDGTVIGTATTDAAGRYLFTNGVGASSPSRRRGIAMEPNLPGYRVRIVRNQPVLAGLDPTVTGSDGAAGVGRDSDGAADATTSTSDVLTSPLPAVGMHTYDFGFAYTDASRRNSPAAPPAPVATTTAPPQAPAVPLAPRITPGDHLQLALTGASTWWAALAALVLLLAGLSLLETSEPVITRQPRE
jgi:hypothetical protein